MYVEGKLACADSSFPRLSHAAALEVIRDLGIAAVDICVFAGCEHTTPEAVIADPAATAAAVAGRLVATDLAVSDVFTILAEDFETLAVNHPDRSIREESLAHFGSVVDFAVRIGAPGLTILPGVPFTGVSREAGMSLAAAELQRRAEIAGQAGIDLSIEPHYLSIVQTPAATLELLALAPDVSLSLDYSHFVFQGIHQGDVDPLIGHTRHVHLRQAAPGVMQARAREGTIDFAAILDALDRAGYDGFLTVEYQCEAWLECMRVDCISETADMRDLVLAWAANRPSNGDNRRH